MFSILRKKNIEVHLYTDSRLIYNFFQCKRAVDYYPKWWKDLPKPKTISSPLTMKTCYGFLELYKKSFVMPLWADFEVLPKKPETKFEYDENSIFQKESKHLEVICSDKSFNYSFHNPVQYGDMIDNNVHDIIKFLPSWKVVCNEDVDFMISDMFYNKNFADENFSILPGMMNFKYQNSINFFMKIKKTHMSFKAGMPILMITPITERKVKIFHHFDLKAATILEDELESGGITFPTFHNRMFNKIKANKENDNLGKCPLGFGKSEWK